MPRTHADIDRTERVDRIVAAAERMFTEKGYRGTTMAGIAREVGVANNSVYWYFPSKDALFCTVVERVHFDRFHTLVERPPASPAAGLLWFLGELESHRDWWVVIHERRRHSPEISALYDRLRDLYQMWLRGSLHKLGLTPREARLTQSALMFMLHGMLFEEDFEEPRAELLEFVMSRFLPEGP